MTGAALGDPIAEIRAELRQMEAAHAHLAAALQAAASRLKASAEGVDEQAAVEVPREVVVAVVRLLRQIATGSASRQIKQRAHELARAVNR